MRVPTPSLIVLVLVLAAASARAEDNSPCPYLGMWRPTPEQLKEILLDHREWHKKEGWKAPAASGRATLCRADLSGADLADTDLSGADLRSANLSEADLRHANLAGPGQCDEATVVPANLEGARLRAADLEGAQLCWVNLSRADLSKAILPGATLFHAKLMKATLWEADPSGARLDWAELTGANLGGAKLPGAYLPGTDLQDAELRGADLTEACYAPATAPARGSLAGLKGVDTTWFSEGEESGLVQLRDQLQGAGLRELERKATYAIERNKTRHLLFFREGHVEGEAEEACGPHTGDDRGKEEVRWREPLKLVEGGLRLVFLEWPVAYGLYPGRAFLILFGSIGLFSVGYIIPLLMLGGKDGVYRIWPKERLDLGANDAQWCEQVRVERLQPTGPLTVLRDALQFSVLSAFHLGWREIDVGNWIARLQTREYTLRALGWVRAVAGIQSLISVYLLALWALTYFGRPFQ